MLEPRYGSTMRAQRTIAVTGSASGMGRATTERLRSQGERVIGIDLADAEVTADLGSDEGRRRCVAEVTDLADGILDAVVTWAGLGGLPGRPGSLLASVNYFGTVAVLEGLRPALARAPQPAAVAVASNSMTVQPGVPLDVVERCLEGDEEGAREAADRATSVMTYPATKLALTRWVRRHAPSAAWAGSGITLNAIAPGPVETPLLQATRADATLGPLLEAFAVPIGRNGTPDELAGVVEFLIGPDARFLCGSVVVVDGGTEASLRPDDLWTAWG